MTRLSLVLRTMLASAALIQALAPSCPCRWRTSAGTVTDASHCEQLHRRCCGHSLPHRSETPIRQEEPTPIPAPCECPDCIGESLAATREVNQHRVKQRGASECAEGLSSSERPSPTCIVPIAFANALDPPVPIAMRLQV